jgi:hypothetical protein
MDLVLRLSSDCRIALVMLALAVPARSATASFNFGDQRLNSDHRAI